MTERISEITDGFLDGIEWTEYQKSKAVITSVYHGYDWISVVNLTCGGMYYQVALNTMHLNLEEKDLACSNVPNWWNESKNTGALYQIDGEVF